MLYLVIGGSTIRGEVDCVFLLSLFIFSWGLFPTLERRHLCLLVFLNASTPIILIVWLMLVLSKYFSTSLTVFGFLCRRVLKRAVKERCEIAFLWFLRLFLLAFGAFQCFAFIIYCHKMWLSCCFLILNFHEWVRVDSAGLLISLALVSGVALARKWFFAWKKDCFNPFVDQKVILIILSAWLS